MKIRFERKELLSKIRLAKNATSPKGYNPLWQNVKIVADKRHRTIIHATDGAHSIRIRFNSEVAEKGALLLPIKEMDKVLPFYLFPIMICQATSIYSTCLQNEACFRLL